MINLRKVSGSEKMNTDSEPNKNEQPLKRSCADCHTTRTPLWRGGPAGPRSLCNACGIRFRKQRSALLGLGKGRREKNEKKIKRRSSESGNSEIVSVKLRLMALGGDMVLKKRKLGEEEEEEEEEEAAILLMALSSGSVHASL